MVLPVIAVGEIDRSHETDGVFGAWVAPTCASEPFRKLASNTSTCAVSGRLSKAARLAIESQSETLSPSFKHATDGRTDLVSSAVFYIEGT